MYAFVYDHKNDDYKLVIAEDHKHGSSVYAYTLGSNSWKTDIEVPYRFFNDRISGVFVNGWFHWLAADKGCWQSKLIVSLDIRDVRFEELELPMELKEEHEHYGRFITEGVLEGCLCILAVDTGYNHPGPVEVWAMQDYGVRESWTKRYTIKNEIIIRIIYPWCPTRTLSFICCFKNGKILFKTFLGKLVLYDPKDGSAVERDIKSICNLRSKVIYTESLVSVNSGNYVRKGEIQELFETEDA
ncbi:F-box/kelch-repeat protein At3g06240-like [Papaver somniferum]|uniref:F-box/kelch-repeat protein At3g06240-like n=1 Tax=Papaver somniferum TaxID=3469 RepID=UPI000E702714|nr:F-box/kelch-repeat protein At3g06240-like [Papaver somniferum]